MGRMYGEERNICGWDVHMVRLGIALCGMFVRLRIALGGMYCEERNICGWDVL